MYQFKDHMLGPWSLSYCRICLTYLNPVQMASGAAFERLVRFETDQGKLLYGNLSTAFATDAIIGSSVEILDGDVLTGFNKTGCQATIGKARPFVRRQRIADQN